MEDIEKIIASRPLSPPKKPRGGKREGAGRPAASRDQITIKNLLEELHKQTGGKDYESLLVQDFLSARDRNDTQLMIKYHQLILNKVMTTMAKIEVTDSKENIEAKQAAFAAALARLTGVNSE